MESEDSKISKLYNLGISLLRRIIHKRAERSIATLKADSTTKSVPTYESRLKAQIEQYHGVENIHDLPDIFHYWSNKFLRPRMNEVHGADSITDFYAIPFAEASKRTICPIRFLSLGSSDCGVEINIAKRLLTFGIRDFSFTCFEVSPFLIDRALQAIKGEKLEDIFSVECVEINRWSPSNDYTGIMANHSLHHFVELEKIFDAIKTSLQSDGIFVTNDMIGRNGHLRWPETLEVIEKIWAFLPDRYKFNRLLNRFEEQFVNWDCSSEGFEGVRSQDILPLLLQRFQFKAFLAFGGIIDIFTDRAFGHNFDPNQERDKAFIDFLSFLNDTLIDDGIVKPTTMFAVISSEPVNEIRQWRHWSPKYSVREP